MAHLCTVYYKRALNRKVYRRGKVTEGFEGKGGRAFGVQFKFIEVSALGPD